LEGRGFEPRLFDIQNGVRLKIGLQLSLNWFTNVTFSCGNYYHLVTTYRRKYFITLSATNQTQHSVNLTNPLMQSAITLMHSIQHKDGIHFYQQKSIPNLQKHNFCPFLQ
jgi:hypothetical protein